MPVIRARTQSYSSLYRMMEGQTTPKKNQRPKVRVEVKGKTERPIIIVHNHLPPVSCNAHRRRRKVTEPPRPPSVPEVVPPGWRGCLYRGKKYGRRVAVFVVQAMMLVSSCMPRVSVGIGINPIWPDTWPSIFRRR